ncbi:MAG: uroporphyrinogen decarboxylase family protein [Eubacteriales bacterium]|nr:uroporphyrinogen decarboxylase family protein [Eubacteriales bacterium]
MLNGRQNYLETARFGRPEYIPMSIGFNGAMWAVYKGELEEVVLRHPTIFNHKKGSVNYSDMQFSTEELDENYVTDVWGCRWVYPLRYMDGVVIGHPLENFDDIDSYEPPVSPYKREYVAEEWEAELAAVKQAKQAGHLVSGSTDHGIMLLRHTYLRGYENAMIDYATGDERLNRLLDMIVDYYLPLVEYNIKRGADVMCFAEDLGAQTSSLVSPKTFEKWIAPAYNRLMQPCRDNNILTFLHSDGYILDIIDILHRWGVDIINAQDLCNGIDNLAREIKGRACIDLDIDRQSVIPFGTRGDIDDLIRESVTKLGSERGGLMFTCGMYPPTPLENVDALCCALEKYRRWWWE